MEPDELHSSASEDDLPTDTDVRGESSSDEIADVGGQKGKVSYSTGCSQCIYLALRRAVQPVLGLA